MKRDSTNTSVVSAYSDATLSASGSQLSEGLIPGGQKPFSVGGAIRQGTEWVLKPDTRYMFEIFNQAGEAKDFSLQAEWYEVA